MWFRRDLRVHDNAALAAALAQAECVYCVFVFDTDILAPLLDANNPYASATDRRVDFIWRSVAELAGRLEALGGGLIVRHARAVTAIPELAQALGVDAVYTNRDYEPAAVARDDTVRAALQAQGRDLHDYKDQVIFEKSEVLTGAGKFFSVFTPYKNAWLKRLTPRDLEPHLSEQDASEPEVGDALSRQFSAAPAHLLSAPTLEALGFADTQLSSLHIEPGATGGAAAFADFCERMQGYGERRNFPAVKGVSYLSVHVRFGTVSIRGLVREAHARMLQGDRGAEVWLNELIWREFYFQVLHHVPEIAAGRAFKPEYDRIAWRTGAQADADFAAWCEGRTGYPLVDAAMAQLNHSGYMHNRLRMVVASFLVKDLGIDWRRGEACFAARLIDFDFSANNGGWQWAASSGCDAQPWFRIFNPVSQSEKFDADGKFIKRYLPVLAPLSAKLLHAPWQFPLEVKAAGVTLGRDYPLPIVDHAQARLATLDRYAVVKRQAA
jgi:deoxyribodipyrimidine photo-lyase